MNSRIQILSKLTLREKLLTFFSDQAKKSGADTFSVPLDRKDMATYLGADRSALSRELSRMKREGLIDYYRNSFRIIR
ncbi:MAG: winged helix-turn-helix domain-containing protein, partial [Clostridia bacterium]|nr:winged helix-turn-helix domain-containing protein [Clostridia bacterium]